MDAALRRALRSPGEAAARGCDAELAAAYIEGRLDSRERESFETHMAQCAGCRSLCAALVDELAPEAPEAEAPAPAAARPWRMLSWRWAVPALAGVAMVGSVVYYQREQVLERRTAALPAAQTAATLSPPAAPAIAPAAQPPAREEAPRADLPRRAAARVREVVPPLPVAQSAPAPAVVDSELRKEQSAQNAITAAAGKPGPPPPAAAPVPARGAIGGAVPLAEKTASVRDETSGATAAKAAPDGVVAGRAQSAALTNRRLDSLVLPGGARLRNLLRHDGRLWAVSDGGRIFRSADGGRTWTPIESPTTADLVSVKWDAERNLLVVTDQQGNEYRVKP